MSYYKIPYIENKKRLFQAYCRERMLKRMLLGTNVLWVIVVILIIALR